MSENDPRGPPRPALRLKNSLTRGREELPGKKALKWYTCGPTVYDASHMGHARTYVSLDTIRRVLEDYFGYDVTYQMNVTDVDDKIIARGRERALFDGYCADEGIPPGDRLKDINEALEGYYGEGGPARQGGAAARAAQSIEAAPEATPEALERWRAPLTWLLVKRAELQKGAAPPAAAVAAAAEALSRHWEKEFWADFEALGLRLPTAITRVSEHMPEVVEYIGKIAENGYAYEAGGDVYFDVAKFAARPGRAYGKLRRPPEGGDSLGAAGGPGKKRDGRDFALWKAASPGEPSWPSPWGAGRPGWHVECSAMATAVLGGALDIHAGGHDLKFPHHENEIAQAEAYHAADPAWGGPWAAHFLHTGRLDIGGRKMSKSCKNFVTIKEALRAHSARQVRLFFLLHRWDAPIEYSAGALGPAVACEAVFARFYADVARALQAPGAAGRKWAREDAALHAEALAAMREVHGHLCDSINTPLVVARLQALAKKAVAYIAKGGDAGADKALLRSVEARVSRVLKALGVAGFGGTVREKALGLGEAGRPLLRECDRFRDEALPALGVRVEDRQGQPPSVRLTTGDGPGRRSAGGKKAAGR